MNITAIVLTVVGLVMVVISHLNSRHSPTSVKHMGVHRNLDDARIAQQLARGPTKGIADLGKATGVCFVVVGVLWQLVSSLLR